MCKSAVNDLRHGYYICKSSFVCHGSYRWLSLQLYLCHLFTNHRLPIRTRLPIIRRRGKHTDGAFSRCLCVKFAVCWLSDHAIPLNCIRNWGKQHVTLYDDIHSRCSVDAVDIDILVYHL